MGKPANAICVIPARGGSTRIPMKNIKEFHGQPIIAYSIQLAQHCDFFDRIIVSTDSDEIAAVAEQYGAEVYRRPPEFATNEVGTQEVVGQCLHAIGANEHDLAICIYATAPLLRPKEILTGLYVYANDDDAVYLFSAGMDDQGELHDAGGFYIGAALDFMYGTPLGTEHDRLLLLPSNRFCDINTPEDWARAEEMYGDLHHD